MPSTLAHNESIKVGQLKPIKINKINGFFFWLSHPQAFGKEDTHTKARKLLGCWFVKFPMQCCSLHWVCIYLAMHGLTFSWGVEQAIIGLITAVLDN